MTQQGLLDTSTLILLGRLDLSSLPDEPLICTVTLAELSVGPLVIDDDGERAARQAHLQLIASVAVARDLPVYTCNPEDFAGITGLDVREVPQSPRSLEASTQVLVR